MARRISKKKQAQFIASIIIMVILFFINYFNEGKLEENNPQELPPGGFDNIKVVSVYDGDTFKIDLPCQDKPLCKNLSVRVRGIDCAEIKGKTKKEKKLAKKAKKFTQDFLEQGQVSLENCGKDKYFRLLCDVKVKGKDLAQALLESDLAYPYNGGKKSNKFK